MGAELGSALALGRRGARPLRLLAELLRLLAELQLSPGQIRPRALRVWARERMSPKPTLKTMALGTPRRREGDGGELQLRWTNVNIYSSTRPWASRS